MDIKQVDYDNAKKHFQIAVDELKEFQEGEDGKQLRMLRGKLLRREYQGDGEKQYWLRVVGNLEEEKAKLKKTKEEWDKQILQMFQRAAVTTQTGNQLLCDRM